MKQHEKDIFFLITNECNLKCFGCAYGCEKNDNLWYIQKEEFLFGLEKLKNTNFDGCTKYSINITGGEALLHPQWLDFALMARKMHPECICYISTNGLLLPSISDETLLFCNENDIRMGITIYPSLKLLPLYEKIEERFSKLGLKRMLTWNFAKILFGKSSYKQTKIVEDCRNRTYNNCDYCFIYKNKFYTCQVAFYQDRLFENASGGIPISEIQPLQNLKTLNQSFTHCANCQIGIDEKVYWHLDADLPYNITLTPLKELFLSDYKSYYILKHDCKEHKQCLDTPFFKKHCGPAAEYSQRFFDGKADIYIPFSTVPTEQFKQSLLNNQFLKKCNLYFIGINSSKEVNSKTYDLFNPESFDNIYFLQAPSLTSGAHTFLQNSYLDIKYCLDINDANKASTINF